MITELSYSRSYNREVLKCLKKILRCSPLVSRLCGLLSDCVIKDVEHVWMFVLNLRLPKHGALNADFNDHLFAPFLSPECCLTPSNINKEAFMAVSPFNPVKVDSDWLLSALKTYGRMCHLTGVNCCFTMSELKDMFIYAGMPEACLNGSVNAVLQWIFMNLVRSKTEKYCNIDVHSIDLDRCNIDETVAFSCVAWLMSKCMTFGSGSVMEVAYDEHTKHAVELSLEHVVSMLIWKCVNNWYKHGGPVLCMYKMIYMLSIAQDAILSSAQGLIEDCHSAEIEKQHICCFSEFKFFCPIPEPVYDDNSSTDGSTCCDCDSECESCAGGLQLYNADKCSCSRKIIQCCSSSDIMSVVVRDILLHRSEPFEAMEKALFLCCCVSDVKYFVGVNPDVVEKIMNIARSAFYRYDVYSCGDVDQSSSSITTTSMFCNLINIKDNYKRYLLAGSRCYSSKLLYDWIDCINEGACPIILNENRFVRFIRYLVRYYCEYNSGVAGDLSELVFIIESRASECYLSRGNKSLVSDLMDPVCLLLNHCILESEIKLYCLCRWIRISIGNGVSVEYDYDYMSCNEKHVRDRFKRYYSACGMLLLPNEAMA